MTSGRWKHPDAERFLRERYEAYCAQQGADLPGILPRGAVGALYREARRGEGVAGSDGRGRSDFEILADYCRAILPLPPYEVWKSDYHRFGASHVDALIGAGPHDPETVASRAFSDGNREWFAELRVQRAHGQCRGHLRFSSGGADGGGHITGEIFQEADAATVRDRFESFDERTLLAFLRSVLP